MSCIRRNTHSRAASCLPARNSRMPPPVPLSRTALPPAGNIHGSPWKSSCAELSAIAFPCPLPGARRRKCRPPFRMPPGPPFPVPLLPAPTVPARQRRFPRRRESVPWKSPPQDPCDIPARNQQPVPGAPGCCSASRQPGGRHPRSLPPTAHSGSRSTLPFPGTPERWPHPPV